MAGGLRKGRGSSTAFLHQERPHPRPPGRGRRAHPALLPPLPRTRAPAFSAQRCTHLRTRAYGHRAPAATLGATETPSPPGRLERPGSGWGKAERRGPAGGGALPAGGGGSGSAGEWGPGLRGRWAGRWGPGPSCWCGASPGPPKPSWSLRSLPPSLAGASPRGRTSPRDPFARKEPA